MKRVRYLIAFILFALIGGLASSAQSRKPAAKSKFSNLPFELTAKQLSPRYLGHSLADVWGLLAERKKLLKQGEYEKTPAWESRIEKLNAQPLTGTVTLSNKLAFLLSETENSYSPDAETLTIEAKTDKQSYDAINEIGLSGFDSVVWLFDSKSTGSFVGSNSFGVKRRVRTEAETGYYLLFQAGIIGQANKLIIHDVSIEQAKVIRPWLRVLLIGTLAEPYTGGDKDEDGATLDNPVKTSTTYFYVYFKPEAFCFYNFETGEVYYRADLKLSERPKAQK